MSAEFSVSLWVLAAFVSMLVAGVGLAWLHRARRRRTLSKGWAAQLLAAVTIGTGMCASALLGIAAEGLPYPVGYRAIAAPALWVGTMLACLPLVYWLTVNQRWWSLLSVGCLLGLLATSVQYGWVLAGGFRPGVLWNTKRLIVTAGMTAFSLIGALAMAMANSNKEETTDVRRLLPLGGAVWFGLTVMLGQQGVIMASDLTAQRGSVYRYQVPGKLLSLASGALVPLTLSVMGLDLTLRRRRRQSAHANFNPVPRRKKRHRVRSL